MVSSDSSLDGVIDDNIEGTVSRTEYGIRQDPDGEVLGSTHGAADIIKLGGSALGKEMGAALGSEFGTDRGSTDGFSRGNGD